jgi:aminoglycoside phosphotransferase (APT) family kinase protein
MSSPFPPARQAAVERALMAAFGTTELDGAVALSGGLSGAGVWRIRVGGVAYVLRIEGPANAFGDPARAYACMRTAASACLAPRIHHADAADGVAITDHLAPHSLTLDYPGAGRELIVELAQAVRVLHEQPQFPPLIDYLEGLESLAARFREAQILEAAATEELFERFDALRGAYRTAPGDLVSSHNDLNPGNIVYDGTRLWLVDWEAAFLADRYVDLATVAGWFVRDAEGEATLLATYFRRAPEPAERARFQVMRQVNHLFTGLVFLIGAAAEGGGEPLEPRTLEAPPLASLHARLRTGEFAILARENRITYGKARLSAALQGLRSAAFAEALATTAA